MLPKTEIKERYGRNGNKRAHLRAEGRWEGEEAIMPENRVQTHNESRLRATQNERQSREGRGAESEPHWNSALEVKSVMKLFIFAFRQRADRRKMRGRPRGCVGSGRVCVSHVLGEGKKKSWTQEGS